MGKVVKYRRSRISYIHNYILVMLLLVFLYLLFPYIHSQNLVLVAAIGLISLIALVLISEPEYERTYRYYLLEEREFSMIEGVISKKKMSIPYGKITDASISRSFWGRIFNFGDVKISGMRNDIVMNGLRRPQKVCQEVQDKTTDKIEIRDEDKEEVKPKGKK